MSELILEKGKTAIDFSGEATKFIVAVRSSISIPLFGSPEICQYKKTNTIIDIAIIIALASRLVAGDEVDSTPIGVFLIPSIVISFFQEKINQTGNPKIKKNNTNFRVYVGASIVGRRIAITCIITQAAIK